MQTLAFALKLDRFGGARAQIDGYYLVWSSGPAAKKWQRMLSLLYSSGLNCKHYSRKARSPGEATSRMAHLGSITKVRRKRAPIAELVCCSQIGWAFVAPHLAFGAARRGSISAAICDRGATKPKAKCGATRWAAGLFGSDFVVRSLQTAEGYARRSRLVCTHNPLPQMPT